MNIEKKEKRVAKLEQDFQDKSELSTTVAALTEEEEQQRLEDEELKQKTLDQAKLIKTLQNELDALKNETAHKERLADGFHKKAIKALKENKEFSQTLQTYREEIEDKNTVIAELAKEVESLIQSDSESREMNRRLEEMLLRSSDVSKAVF